MQQKQEKTTLQEETLRYRLLPLFKTNVPVNIIPLPALQVIFQFVPYLQVLKFSIDYFTLDWLGYNQPIFSFLDASYYLNLAPSAFPAALIASLVFMNLYWLIQFSAFLSGKQLSNTMANIRKFVFIFAKNILFLPFFNVILGVFGCQTSDPFRQCFGNYGLQMKIITLVSFIIFALFLAAQSYFNFQFLPSRKQFRRVKRSCFTSVALLGFLIVNEATSAFLENVAQLVVLDISSLLLLVLFLVKDEQINERMKLLELSFLGVNKLALVMVNIVFFTSQNLSLLLFFFLACFLVAGIMQLRTYSLKFELENINKWPTADIMIRYADTLRYYLSRRDEYIFMVYIHGYMEIHRQKCDNPSCPSRCALSDYEKKLFQYGQLRKEDEQLLRCENIIKKIYSDGYRLTPISAELQLENATFLYEKKEKELALKNLLMIKYQQLPYDKYYRYNLLKEKIHKEMCEEPNKQFLDLVSELQVKREEDEIMKKFQKAALINLQFWSVLNEDHPDFQKLNEIGAARIQIRSEVKASYEAICSIAHSEKVTSLYVHYLQTIENDEAMYNAIYEGVKEQYGLGEKIVLQDWANTSNAILLVSIEDANYGTIIDINSSCASMFGYQRYEILNRPFKLLFTDELKDGIKEFLTPQHHDENYFMTHKSGYLLKVKRRSQNYNSMQTGMASIITLQLQLAPTSCFFLVSKTDKIIGISASTIPLVGLQLKTFEGEVLSKNFFSFPLSDLPTLTQDKDKLHFVSDLIKNEYESDIIDYSSRTFRMTYEERTRFTAIEFHGVKLKETRGRHRESGVQMTFEFQVQATLTSFKYFGNFDSHESYLSQFSQLNYAESLKQANSSHDYAKDISTLRLRDNIIQVIEENEEEQVEGYQRKGSDESSLVENIARKDEEEIFQSKSAFQQFIGGYKFARSVNLILLLSMFGLLGLYIAYYFLFCSHNSSVLTLTSEIANQNLIIGAVAKQLSLIRSLDLMSANLSQDTPTRFTQIYSDNIRHLEQIKLNGASPYQISISLGSSTQTFLTDEFLLSFINYALGIYSNMSSAKSQTDLVSTYAAADPYTIDYLKTNSAAAKQTMMDRAKSRETQISSTIKQFMYSEVVMMVAGVVFVGVFGAILLLAVHKINQERIKIFEIFLDITEIQIQQFSSKTEKFLMSLHVEDTNGEIDVDEQVENTKKINSSTFAKKKRFKLINFNKSIYCKLLLIPLIATAFFLHSFLQSYMNLTFQSNSYHYFFLTSEGDYQFYSGLAKVQQALLTNQTLPNQLSMDYILYYRDYFDTHYNTFGYVDDFHQVFTDVFMLDICNGIDTLYGSTSIKQSCEIPLLYPNGSYLVFTDTAMRTEFLTDASSLTYQHLVSYQVLSKTHRLLTNYLLKAQNNLITTTLSSLLTSLLTWILIMGGVAFLYGVPIMKRFIDEINEIKNILSILPVSVARELPLATKYFNKILKSDACC